MQLLDLTLPTPEENLALDEALLEEAEQATSPVELLRLWEPDDPLVVIGRASKLHEEVDVETCQARGISVLRRASGGASVVTGRGCLMYAVVLSYELHPELAALDACHRYVMGRIQSALVREVPEVDFQGTCDLTLNGRKFSGNSLRCKRSHLIYHGTLLYDFDLSLIHTLLRTPPRMPDYRQQRPHRSFVTNVPIARDILRRNLIEAWQVQENTKTWPEAMTAKLVAEKYTNPQWTSMR
ncbi:lipoate--protein ligase family protein [Bremerella cremea]|uniref:Lipoate--protein ligase family protein n=1 Tax=Bremerella cremea TaxID=1031537 RepID=A0A368KSV8_9BACT|nr:lipoate--protein ligase family protein [Bremerella cremea]RCS52735.1 lipoate--protein ligase family protein [Bremerella cremea]